MRKFVIAVAVVIPLIFISGIALIIIGGTQNETLSLIGTMIMSLGLPITMVILVGVGLVIMITKGASVGNNDKKKVYKEQYCSDSVSENEDVEKEDDKSVGEREKEYSDIEGINTTYGSENKINRDKYVIQRSADIYKNSSTKQKILGWMFLGFLLLSVILTLIFAFFGNKLGMFICFGLFVGTIIISAIVKFISEKVSMNAKIYTKSQKREILEGKVKHCFFSSSVSVGGGSGRAHWHTERLIKVTYRVVVTAGGKDYNAYTTDFYETNDDVKIAVIGRNRAKIVTEDELEKSESLLK